MKEYIEREALIKETTEYCDNDPWGFMRGPMEAERRKRYFKLFRLVVQKFPAADVVEVVRCKDCKYCVPATADGAEYELCIVDNDVFPVSVQKQHFCSRGKRKEE